jgi:Fic family protein
MHEQSLVDSIFTSIFTDEDTYRKHYIPTVNHVRKNPKSTDRIKELVDNVTMKFCKNNHMDYKSIPQEAKDQLIEELYNEIVDREIGDKK